MQLIEALLDFERMPGRYPLGLREPRVLFEHMHTVMMLACGRPVPELAAHAQEESAEDALRRASRFFIRTALLRPGADHLTVLGLSTGFNAETLRDHYRMMIRMTHPDFAAADGEGNIWPADAAQRINAANDALQTLLGTPAPQGHAVTSPTATPATQVKKAPVSVAARVGRRAPATGPTARRPQTPMRWRWAIAVLGVLVTGVALLMDSTRSSGNLTVRKPAELEVNSPALLQSAALQSGEPSEASRSLPDAGTAGVAADPAAAVLAQGVSVDASAPTEPGISLTVDRQLQRMPSLRATVETRKNEEVAERPPLVRSVTEPAPAVAATRPPPAPDLVPGQDSTTLSATEHREAVAARQPSTIALSQVQPTLSNVMSSLHAGKGASLAQWIDPNWRSQPSAQTFVNQFDQMLAGRKVRQVGKIALDSRAQEARLVVEGVIEMELLDARNQTERRDLHLTATFQNQDGRPVLTHLMAGHLR